MFECAGNAVLHIQMSKSASETPYHGATFCSFVLSPRLRVQRRPSQQLSPRKPFSLSVSPRSVNANAQPSQRSPYQVGMCTESLHVDTRFAHAHTCTPHTRLPHHILSLFHTLSFTFRTCWRTHTHTHTRYLTLAFFHSQPHTYTLTYTRGTRTHSHPLSLSLTSHTHSLNLKVTMTSTPHTLRMPTASYASQALLLSFSPTDIASFACHRVPRVPCPTCPVSCRACLKHRHQQQQELQECSYPLLSPHSPHSQSLS